MARTRRSGSELIAELLALPRVVASLDEPVLHDGELILTVADVVASDHGQQAAELEHGIDLERLGADLRRAVAGLPACERQVIALRYGLSGGEPLPAADVAAALCCNWSSVHRRTRRALLLLRRRMGLAA